ncbi:hypothetical protein [Acholeplasma hippikon]|uniref:Uncharacterized protein n=1 Tax=Acholeplasma hippikon TaxID=264636 RepID=A0A449BJK5_9MOLU|nr:hypothetical protein [Acholeplasma hippikon]VEU82573.1 Uncharacterised protein [Acholeplasma hippikon]
MAQFDKGGHLIVKGKQYQIGDLVGKLIYIPGNHLANYLQDIGLNIPRKLRMGVLKNVLRQSVEKTIEERKSLADEMGYRLTWFSRYTDSQLVNLLEWYKSPSLSRKYLEEFWVVLLGHLVEKGVSENDLLYLFEEATKAETTHVLPQSKQFNQQIEDVLYDEKGEIDGVTQDAFRPVTYKASTLTELRAIDDKFDAPIPKRLKKQEVLDIILVKLRERGQLTRELEDKLSGQNILLLERYAKDNDIKVSTELKKEEIIEYILSNAKETKEAYFVPASSAVYEKQVDEVEESFTSEVTSNLEETVQEEKMEEVKEETKEEVKEEIKQEVIEKEVVKEVYRESVDYKPEFERLAKAFEQLAVAFEKKEFVVNINPVVSIDEPTKPVQVDNAQIIKELLKEEEDFPVNIQPTQASQQPVVVQQIGEALGVPVQTPVEVKKNKKGEVVAEAPFAPIKVGKQFKMAKGLSKLAGLFALLSSIIWLAFAVVVLPIENFSQLDFINGYIPFYDLTQINVWYLVGGGAFLFLMNLILAIRLFKVKLKRASAIFFGIIELATGFGITGLLMLIGSFRKAQPIYKPHPQDGVGRIVEAINNLGTNLGGKKQKGESGKKAGRAIFMIFFVILAIVFAVLLILFLIWRLDFTYGYENIEVMNFGPWLRDNIIIKLFGKSHFKS